MNKLLTTVMLIFLPIASFADIYSCTNQKGSWIDPDDGTVSPALYDLALPPTTFIVDTERGIRRGLVEEGYSGSCQSRRHAAGGQLFVNIYCNSDLGKLNEIVTSLIIQTRDDGVLRFHAAFLGGANGELLRFHAGLCVEI